ncbi:U2 small nuclear ribonucleoprotein A [Euphorbia peplus]|nr:U2 small nuclear ribonucleoprotein A [Euphorbia peplus]
MQAAIVNSQILEEVARLEKALSSGQIPADLKILETNLGSNIVMEKDDKMNSENSDEIEAELGNPGDQMGTEPMEQE